jgi:TolB-like protein
LIVSLLAVPTLSSQESTKTQLITIAVMELTVQGEMEAHEARLLTELLQSAIKDTAVFEVVERDKINEVSKEKMRGLTGSFENVGEIGSLLAAQQLLVGSVGRLFDNIVLTVRLVETETGRIIIADTVYTEKVNIERDIKRLAVRLGTKALDSTREISIPIIKGEMDEKRYATAKRYLDVYIQRSGLSPSVREIREELLPLLAKQYAQEASDFRKKQKFEEAIEKIQAALALRIEEEYIRLRDRILKEEREYEKEP